MTRLLIKICGITNEPDAIAAIQAGADWLGLIFVPGTPRFITIETAQVILEKVRSANPKTQVVGVFQNASHETIQAHLDRLPLNQIQLHGNESPEFCAQIQVPVIKTILIQPELDHAHLNTQAAAYLQQPNVQYLLLDLPKGAFLKNVLNLPNPETFKQFLSQFPCLLAGGLNPENTRQALERFQPGGVDVASGVEQSPGRKDVEKMNRFCEIVQKFNPQPNRGDHPSCNL